LRNREPKLKLKVISISEPNHHPNSSELGRLGGGRGNNYRDHGTPHKKEENIEQEWEQIDQHDLVMLLY
jgi:hypothetical protein